MFGFYTIYIIFKRFYVVSISAIHQLIQFIQGGRVMRRIAVCDDNIAFLKEFCVTLTNQLNRFVKDTLDIFDYTVGDLLLEHHRRNPFDIVFLDIDMPGIDGFELASKLSESHECIIVFITNHAELVYDSFKFRPLNFIYKKSDEYIESRLVEVAKQISSQIKQDEVVIINNRDEQRFSIPVKNIVYIESAKHYLIIFTTDEKEIKYRGSISEAEEYYSKFDFIRIHRKYLANLKYILNIDKTGKTVIFKQRFELPLGNLYKNAVDNILTEYVRQV